MTRPAKTAPIDLTKPHSLSLALIERLQCPDGKEQAFLRDSEEPGLAVRVTRNGTKSFIFEARVGLESKNMRRTLGNVRHLTIAEARTRAHEMRGIKLAKKDPREVEQELREQETARKAAEAAQREQQAHEQSRQSMTVGEAWNAYLADRREHWSERHYRDHLEKARAGGKETKRGTRGRGVTIAGPLHPLMGMRLTDMTPTVIAAWATAEAKKRRTAAQLAWRQLRAFLSWCAEHPTFSHVVPSVNPARAKAVGKAVGKAGVKRDALQREQLPSWFAAVRSLDNATAAAYFQIILLTGARPGEVLSLRWSDINWKWHGITIRDKVEGERTIPLTPYVSHLLASLPRINELVFPSIREGKPTGDANAAERTMRKPNHLHDRACEVAGIDGLTLHGLRRSFKSLCEWQEMPVGIVAQIMGHKPSAIAEKHYTVRPLDLLRVYHKRIEKWMLEQAGIQYIEEVEAPKLRAVN